MTHNAQTGAGNVRPDDWKICTDSEAELEAAIAAAYQRLINAPTWEEKLERWREMVKLIDQRTPARVRFMERTRGLA